MQIDVQLINESQLGSRLNHAIENNRRGEFGLLLSMLSIDARDMSQFQLDNETDETKRLRKQFQLGHQQALTEVLNSDHDPTDHSQLFIQEGSCSFRLHHAMKPEALVIRGQQSMSMNQVLSNCDAVTKLRHLKQIQTPLTDTEHLSEQLAKQRQFEIAV